MLLLVLHTAKGCAGTAEARVTGTCVKSKTKLGACGKACTGLAALSKVPTDGSQATRTPLVPPVRDGVCAPPAAPVPPW